jgi:hypothetical protein
VRESEIDERVPSRVFLFHVPYRLRRNSNLYANFFLAKASCRSNLLFARGESSKEIRREVS